jgi:hypothetical protein
MPGERLLRILERLSPSDAQPSTARLCDVARDVASMTGAGIMLMSGDIPRGSLCSSNHVSALLEDLQFTHGEGPCVDAYNLDQPVLEADLADPETSRWLAFSPPAVAAGARAVFGFPVQVGVARLGSLNLYRDQPGALTHDQYADSLVMAGVAARAVIAMQADSPPGSLPDAIAEGANLRFVVHQAAGMVSVQLGVSIAEALIRLRAYAFSNDLLLDDVARDVVGRRTRFESEPDHGN